ncbi:hypothetical protein HID58_070906 [Brassica napus]|uniref:Uncharacterized protein n=1 Tax=Brassica napus TaxID=3708 RepID=A0ABQ7Z034_BRANA|nr:hypothetical protein HID58_070906 [Brassica napus]
MFLTVAWLLAHQSWLSSSASLGRILSLGPCFCIASLLRYLLDKLDSESFLSSSSNPNHSIFSVASDRDLLLGKSSASFSFLCILAVCSLFIAWNHPENVVSSCVVAQWGIRRPQVAVKASFYPTRLESHLDNNVGDAGVSSVAKACASSLKTLKLLDCYKNLETLIIGGCRDISDESIILMVDSYSVDYRECTNLLVDSAHCHLGRLSFEILREIVRDGDDETCVVSWMGSSSRIDKATFFGAWLWKQMVQVFTCNLFVKGYESPQLMVVVAVAAGFFMSLDVADFWKSLWSEKAVLGLSFMVKVEVVPEVVLRKRCLVVRHKASIRVVVMMFCKVSINNNIIVTSY